jgi:chromosome segregation ATPase
LNRFAQQIDALIQPVSVSPDALISGIRSMSANLQTSEGEVDRLRKALEEVRSQKTAENAALRQFESIKKELAEAKQLNEVLNSRAKDAKKRLSELESEFRTATEQTLNGATELIKDLMDSVFQNMVREFPMDGRFTGAEVADQLGQLLKKQSGRTFTVLNERGLK